MYIVPYPCRAFLVCFSTAFFEKVLRTGGVVRKYCRTASTYSAVHSRPVPPADPCRQRASGAWGTQNSRKSYIDHTWYVMTFRGWRMYDRCMISRRWGTLYYEWLVPVAPIYVRDMSWSAHTDHSILDAQFKPAFFFLTNLYYSYTSRFPLLTISNQHSF